MFYKRPIEQPPTDKAEIAKMAKEVTMSYNFDRPEAIDWEMMGKALDALIQRKAYLAPHFDEKTKTR